MTILPIDEINAFEYKLAPHFENGRIKSKQDAEDIIDELLDLFLLAYANGVESVNAVAPTPYEPTTDDVQSTVYEKIKGRTWEERVWDYYDNGGDISRIMDIVRTESHRDANAAAYNAAEKTGAKRSRWNCMMLPTSRETHVYLDGVSAPIGGYYYSFMGGKTKYPGQWGIAEEDCGCLCWLTFEW